MGTLILSMAFKGADRATRPRGPFSGGTISTRQVAPWYGRTAVFMVYLLVAVVAIRGTLRQGPPLRWGDVYTTDSNFANQLGLNGTLSLIAAAKARFGEDRANIWKATLEQPLATQTVRDMLVLPQEKLVDTDTAAVRRDFTPPAEKTLPIKNVVVILMESFAGHSVGALGRPGNITPVLRQADPRGPAVRPLLLQRHPHPPGYVRHHGLLPEPAGFRIPDADPGRQPQAVGPAAAAQCA